MNNMPEKFGRGFALGVGAWLLTSVHLVAACVVSYAVKLFLLFNGAYDDLQTSTFSVIVALGVYNIFLYCYKDLAAATKSQKDATKQLQEYIAKKLEE